MATVRKTVSLGQKLTKKQRDEISKCANHTIVFDKDCPELTTTQLAEFAAQARALRNKKQISLKISSEILEKYKALGKGYTGIMSDVLAYAISNPDLIKKAL